MTTLPRIQLRNGNFLSKKLDHLTVKYDKNAYRTVYVAKFKDRLYVLHAFQKKASRGIKTPKREVDLIKERYKYVREIEKY